MIIIFILLKKWLFQFLQIDFNILTLLFLIFRFVFFLLQFFTKLVIIIFNFHSFYFMSTKGKIILKLFNYLLILVYHYCQFNSIELLIIRLLIKEDSLFH